MNNITRSMLTSPTIDSGVLSTHPPLPSEHEKLVKNTQKWVAQTFYGAMLKEMRKSPFRSEELEGGRGGEAFEEMFDQRIADHMSQAAGSPLVNSIVNRIEAKRNIHSAKTIRDAKSAYALAMRRAQDKNDQHGLAGKPRHVGEFPWNRGRLPQPMDEDTQNKQQIKLPAPATGHRRQERILPELYHVAPTS
jgi:Rod binding domain-containing protein